MRLIRFAVAVAATTSSALGGPLEFSSEPGPALNIARAMMSAERGEPLGSDDPVSIALVDLDGDDTRDIIAFAEASYFCGSAGCIPRVYRLERETGKWSELPLESEAVINGEASMWAVGDRAASGWLDLVFTAPHVTLTFAWNGEAYSSD